MRPRIPHEPESHRVELNKQGDRPTLVGYLLGDGMILHIHKTCGAQVRMSVNARPGLAAMQGVLMAADNEDVEDSEPLKRHAGQAS